MKLFADESLSMKKRTIPGKTDWLKIPLAIGISVLVLVIGAKIVLTLTGPRLGPPPEALADPDTLAALIQGQPIPRPVEVRRGEFEGKFFTPPPLSSLTLNPDELGVTTPADDNKRIEVDLTRQRLYAYEGTKKIFDFAVATGKWYPTPTGEFRIWAKLRSTRMTGGDPSIGTYYDLPNVPYVMFFYNDEVGKGRGFSLHGTYWHNNFGHPMSHGCVNMRTPEAKKLFEWATPQITDPEAWSTNATDDNPGTRIIIYGEPPAE